MLAQYRLIATAQELPGPFHVLTSDPDNHNSFPSVSDDGKKIAWMRDADTSDRAVYLLSRR